MNYIQNIVHLLFFKRGYNMKIIIGEILILIGTCVYACCVIAGRADEEMDMK